MTQPTIHYSARSRRTGSQPINYFMKQAVENPDLISLAAGLVDPWSLPSTEAEAAFFEIFRNPCSARAALQYGTTTGYLPLREKLLTRTTAMDGFTPNDLSLTTNDVVITTGSQQLLYLLGELLLDPGDLVITEAPSYFVFQGTLGSMGAKTLTVPMDDDGMDTDALEELLTRLDRTGELDRLRFIYTCDYYQNPTGLSLSEPRRRHLVDLVRKHSRKHRILIVEDAAYRELRYDGTDLPSIKRFDLDNEFVVLAMTFSKPCAPGFKTGYGFLPTELMQPLLHLKGNHDFGSSNLTQHLLDRMLENGSYDRHVAQLCEVYRTKRDRMLGALDRAFGSSPAIHWTHPTGGLYVWLTLPPMMDSGPDGRLMHAALEEGMIYVPGQFCYLDAGDGKVPINEARLCHGVVSLEQIDEGIRRLGCAVAKVQGGVTQSVGT